MIILVDGNSFFYRAFHALPPLTTSKGIPTGAIHGVINMITNLLKRKPKSLIVVFDAKGKTFRQDIYQEYKSHRPPMPEDLVSQLEPLQKILVAMGLPVLSVQGVEADDVMGTLAKQFEANNEKVIIASGDKDFAQLVNSNTVLENTMSNKTLDIAGVKEKFQVPPELIIDYLALIGDKVDNVPGVSGCGPKTAVKWLNEYGSVENLLKNAHEIKGKIGEKLQLAKDFLPVAKSLVTIKTDVDIELKEDDLTIKPAIQEELLALIDTYELKALSIYLTKKPQPKVLSFNTVLVQSEKQLSDIVDNLLQFNQIVLDVETDSLQAVSANLIGIALSADELVYYIPIAHHNTSNIDLKIVKKYLNKFLQDEQKTLVGHNLKYDYTVLIQHGFEVYNQLFDTMIASHITSLFDGKHDLDSLALKWFGHTNISYKDVIKEYKNFAFVPLEEAARYAGEDAFITYQLYKKFIKIFAVETWAKKCCSELEFPLVKILAHMEIQGCLLDIDALAKQSQDLALRLTELATKAYAKADMEFNLLSPKQLQDVLYNHMQLPIVKKTPTGQPSTNEEVLVELAKTHEFAQIVLEYRQLAKLKSTYTDALPKQVLSTTKRVHTTFNQAVTTTGRLSSNNPNLQNIPIKSLLGKKIRTAFIAPKDYKIVAFDYSQVELRVMAHISNEPNLIAAFKAGQDVHKTTASEVFGCKLEDVTTAQRRKAKAINFGLIYGMSEFGLAKQLDISRYEAKDYIQMYFSKYPKVYQYITQTKNMAKELGYVESIFGRRLYLPNINANNHVLKMAAQRAAINAPVQGTAADIIKKAMLKVAKVIKPLNAKMILQIHDELVFEVQKDVLNDFLPIVKAAMEQAATLKVALTVDEYIGDFWQ